MAGLTSALKTIEKDRSSLIKALQTAQDHEGYVSDEAIKEISGYFDVPTVDVEGIVSFYAQFKRVKPGKYVISLCDGTACHIKGGALVLNWICDELGIQPGENTEDDLFSLEVVACLGCCSLAPVISINSKVYGNLDRKKLIKILKSYRKMGGAA